MLINYYLSKKKSYYLIHPLTPAQLFHDMELVEKCVDIIADALTFYGFKEDGEPNALGFQLEEVIDFLNNILYMNEKS